MLSWKTVNNALLFPTRCEMKNFDFPTTPSVRPAEMTSNSDLPVDGRDKLPSKESKDHRSRRRRSFSDIWKFNKWTPWLCRYWTFDRQVKCTCQPVTPARSLRRQGLHFSSKDRQRVRINGKWMVPRIEKSLIKPTFLSRGEMMY